MTTTTAISDTETRKLFSRFFEVLGRRARTLIPNRCDREVYLFIADRSLPFGKLSKDIPDRWFLDGVTGKGSTRGHCAGLNMGRAQLYKSRKALKERGLVRDQKVGRCKRYAIVLEPVWFLLSADEREYFAPLLTLVDPGWQADRQVEKVHKVDGQQVHSGDPHTKKHYPFRIEEEEKSSAHKLAPDAGPGASPSSRAEEGQALAQSLVAGGPANLPASPVSQGALSTPIQAARLVPPAARAAKVAKHGRVPRELRGSTLSERFDAAFREFWPDAELPAAPSIKLGKQWEHFALHWRRTDIGPGDWIEWSVKNWRTIYTTVFQHVEFREKEEAKKLAEHPFRSGSGWKTPLNYTEYPDFLCLFRFRATFQREYDRRDSQMIRSGLLPGDKCLRDLLYKGWPLEDAQRKVAERLANAKFREDLEARERALNASIRRLEAKEQDIDNRIAIGRSYERPVKPVSVKPGSLGKHFMMPKGIVTHDIDQMPSLKKHDWVWRDEEECAAV